MKRQSSIVIALIGAMASWCLCAETEVVDGITWTYTVTGDSASLGTGSGGDGYEAIPRATKGAVVIPSTLGNYPVRRIGDCAFMLCASLSSVEIPSTVTSIGRSAFYYSGITNVTIPASVKSISDHAFCCCNDLKTVDILGGVENIAESAFKHGGVVRVTIPSSVTNIGFEAFTENGNLISIDVAPENITYKSENGLLLDKAGEILISGVNGDVVIPSTVTCIERYAFCGCSSLTSVMIPNSVTNICSSAFAGCGALTSVIMPTSVTSVGSGLFRECNSLKEVSIPSCVTRIHEMVDNSWSWNRNGGVKISSVKLCQGITNVSTELVADCTELEKVSIAASVNSIEKDAFKPCEKLSEISFEGMPPVGLKDMGVNSSILIQYDAAYADVWLPMITECGFTNVQTFQDSLVEGGVFTEIIDGINWSYGITNKLAILGYNNTTAVDRLTAGEIVVPTSLGHALLTTICDGAFDGCSKITRLRIPVSVTNVATTTFAECEKLMAFEVVEENPTYASVDGLLYNKSRTVLLCVPKGLTEVTIPASATRIAEGAFDNCSKLMSVTFLGPAPIRVEHAFEGTPSGLVVHADATKAGWISWGGRPLAFDVGTSGGASSLNINLTVTNVVVHYIQTSELSPMSAPISADVGIVNVMTEIKGGNISIPESWTDNYPTFATKFGSNFSDALISETGKFDVGGKPMYVWQDFVAGTDPTDKDSVFKASVTIVEGVPVISYTPKLSAEEAAKRIYTTYGKVKLQDANWTAVPSGHEADYNFFKVTVEMK